MILTPEERQKKKEQFAAMSPRKKAEHIWEYYRAHIFLAVIILAILVSSFRSVAARKDPVLYMALTNVTVSEALETGLTDDFLTSRKYNTKKQEIYLHKDLYISGNPSAENAEYAYTSGLKIMAIIESETMDLVLMNQEAYDLCSSSGYLLDLTELIDPEDPRFSPYLTENLVILEDNSMEVSLGEAEEYTAVTETVLNALEVTGLPLFENAGFSGQVYLGIAANSPRLDACADYLLFLTEA